MRPETHNMMPKAQISAIKSGLMGEESEHFSQKLREITNTIQTMPVTYEQDGKGDEAVAYLHYFMGDMDWYITELDMEPQQLQSFGLSDLGYGGELGYISIVDLVDNGAELDLYWTPRTLAEIKQQGGS